MTYDLSLPVGSLLAFLVGCTAESKRQSAAGYGVLCCTAILYVWHVIPLASSPVTSSLSASYVAAIGFLAVRASINGLVWGSFWGSIGRRFWLRKDLWTRLQSHDANRITSVLGKESAPEGVNASGVVD